MDLAHQHKLMLKILIGSAWIDSQLEPQEITYIEKVLARLDLARDGELQELVKTAVSPEQTQRWLVAYLKDSPDSERLKLLAAIGNLLISDEVVSSVEHDLLDEFHHLMTTIPDPAEPMTSPLSEVGPKILKRVGQFFRRVVKLN